MAITYREVEPAEIPAAFRLGWLTFGGGDEEVPEHFLRPIPGTTRYAAFDERGRHVGKATDAGHEQWWGGRRVVAADVGGVAVAPEVRGGGVARELLRLLLTRARERGAAVSALHPTVSAVYRRLGWEITGHWLRGSIDTASLPRDPAPGVQLRPGEPADRAVLQTLYDEVARGSNGLLTRTGGFFELPPNKELGEDTDAITVAEVDGRAVGALAFARGRGYGPEAELNVHHLYALTPAAAQALVGVLAGWRTVARSVRLSLPPLGAAAAIVPDERATDVRTQVWMHRPVDVVRAVADRGWPAHVSGRVAFRLRDDLAPWNSGDWELRLADGAGELVPATAEPDRWLTVRGFAALYCSAASSTGLVTAGLAGGPDPAALDLLACGPRARLLDYF